MFGQLVDKLAELSDLSNMSLICKGKPLVAYLERYVEEEGPTLLQLAHQLDLAVLTGFDGSTGMFKEEILLEEEARLTDAQSIGASMRSFLDDPEPKNQRRTVAALDDRLNSRSTSNSVALRHLYKASELHIKAQDGVDDRLIFWAWLLLAWETPSSKGALIESYLNIVTRYCAFCNSGYNETEKLLHLDPVLDARVSGKGDDLSSLERAKSALVDTLAKRVCDRSGAATPKWMLMLKIALELG